MHPRIVPYLCRCNLDKIPSTYLEVPGGFDAVDIRFSEPHGDLIVEGNEYVRNVLLAKAVSPRLGKAQFQAFLTDGKRCHLLDGPCEYLSLHVDLGKRGYCHGVEFIEDSPITIRLDWEKSLEQAFAEFEDVSPEGITKSTRHREVIKNCLRIIATIGFMANTPEDNFVEYDVLSKDRQKFADGDAETRSRIIDRAHRRGKHGWNVGTNEMFLGAVPRWSSDGFVGHRREHSHAHIRAGHFHAVRCGEGRRNVKVKWYRPTVVRPDLRFA